MHGRSVDKRMNWLLDILIVAIVIVGALFLWNIPKYSRQTLFYVYDSQDDTNYRIPGIVALDDGTVVAYCEKRQGASDWADICIACRVSKDRGASWSREMILAGDSDTGTYNNPIMIADQQGTLHCLYCKEYGLEEKDGGVYHIMSSDGGLTWSAPENISECTLPSYRNAFALGPGHGICLDDGTLLVGVWMVPKEYGAELESHAPSVISTLYSKDGGENWELGEILEGTEAIKSPSEAALVQLADGKVLLNVRNVGEEKYRAVAVSPDGISGWSRLALDEDLPDPTCMAGMARYDDSTILFVNAANQSARNDMTVRMSRDDGASWNTGKVLISSDGGYADINVGNKFPRKMIYVLAEEHDANGKFMLVLYSFTKNWL